MTTLRQLITQTGYDKAEASIHFYLNKYGEYKIKIMILPGEIPIDKLSTLISDFIPPYEHGDWFLTKRGEIACYITGEELFPRGTIRFR